MKRIWTMMAARVDAMSLRERVFLFATLLILCMVLADLLWLSPVQAGYKQGTQRVAAQNAELQVLREELKNTGAETGAARTMHEELAQLNERLDAVNKEIAALPHAEQGVALNEALVHFLRRHEGLVLVRTATLPPAAPRSGDTTPAKGAASIQRQGMELTVAGPYAELTRYVRTLERALPALRWGAMKIESPMQPSELTLQIWLVGEGA